MVRELTFALLLVTSLAAAQDGADERRGSQDENGPPQSDSSAPIVDADPGNAEQGSSDVKTLQGMSILGNEEAPKSLVIVPWKSSEIGDGIGVTNALDERARPVDKEVFMRELRYYELRSGGQP
jgi:hypothetical protein